MSRSIALCLLFAACSHSAPATQPKPVADDDHTLCVQMFQHNRTCTDTYIPALVDARARHDVPAGIAAQVASNRDGVIAEAKQEWAGDSTDAAIGATCDKIVASMPEADRQVERSTATTCVAKADCGAYTTCVMPIFEKHFTK